MSVLVAIMDEFGVEIRPAKYLKDMWEVTGYHGKAVQDFAAHLIREEATFQVWDGDLFMTTDALEEYKKYYVTIRGPV